MIHLLTLSLFGLGKRKIRPLKFPLYPFTYMREYRRSNYFCSIKRNPIIADLFHRMGKVERMGSGIERMRDLMREAGMKEPVFEMDTFFRVTFYRDPRYSLKADRFQKAGKKDG